MKKKLIQRNDSTVRYPFYTDIELAAMERNSIHIPSEIGDIAAENEDIWDIIDELIDAKYSAPLNPPSHDRVRGVYSIGVEEYIFVWEV